MLSSRSSLKRDKPLAFWDELRNEPFEAVEDSAVIAVDGVRLAHLVSIMPYSEITSDSSRVLSDIVYNEEAAGFLAMQHFNQRSGEVLPHLPQRLQECDVHFTMDLYDSLFSPIVASRKLHNMLGHTTSSSLHTPSSTLPVALVGAALSSVSLPLSVISGAYNVPHMNGVSTSSALDNKDISPTFMRTVPTNAVDARAAVEYFRSLGVYRFGVLFTRDAYGSQFSRDLQNAAKMYDMKVVAVSYEDNNASLSTIRDAIRMLKESQLKYFFGVMSYDPGMVKTILREASDAGIIGNTEYAWVFSESSITLTDHEFYKKSILVDNPEDLKIANAISGTGVVLLDIPNNDAFDRAMSEMGADRDLLNYYISKHDYPAVFHNVSFSPAPSLYQKLNYDAVMALGIALCDAEQEFITADELVEQIKTTQFEGASGNVMFDAVTGTRKPETVAFKVVNLVVDVTEQGIHLNVSDSMSIKLETNEVHVHSPFVYGGGSMQAPPSLPPIEQELNLIPIWAQSFVWFLSGLVILTSIGFALWTYHNRKAKVVRAAQPPFLLLMCLGTFLMATGLIPMSLQEPISQGGLNIACMSVPWLLVIGFSLALSSLMCKAIRLNKVFTLSLQMIRSTVQAKDVIWPLVVILTTNGSLLVAWSLVAPVEWVRTDNTHHLDQFGRSVESYGTCAYFMGKHGGAYFIVSLFVVNVAFVMFACYQSYLTRNMPSEFNEHYYLCVSMASILEGFLIGIPIAIVAHEDPTASITVLSVVVAFLCFAIQFPMFVSKLVMRRKQKKSQADNKWHIALEAARAAARVERETSHSFSEEPAVSQGQHLPPSTNTVEEIRLRAARRMAEEPQAIDAGVFS